MKKYRVVIPIDAWEIREVEADNEEDAKAQAADGKGETIRIDHGFWSDDTDDWDVQEITDNEIRG